MKILAIDPGTEQSGVVVLDGSRVTLAEILPNAEVRTFLRSWFGDVVACEWIASYGMAVGQETFDTCKWVGRFEEVISGRRGTMALVFRKDVKLHVCNNGRAKDKNIRQALIDLWGGKAKAIGTSKQPGPLYGVKSHCWQALAVAVTVRDTQLARAA
jgi:hypothetical protein